MSKVELSIVFVTVPNIEVARELSRELLNRNLVACVNILAGVESHYRWHGELEHTNEAMLVMKSESSLWVALEKTVKDFHPYATPEIISLPTDRVEQRYLAWALGETVEKFMKAP